MSGTHRRYRRLAGEPVGILSLLGGEDVKEAELLFGAARKHGAVRLKTAIDEFLLRVDSLPWDTYAARRYADLRAALGIGGILMGNLDMMIAAHALAVEAVLVTNDRSFRRLTHLKIEDWTK